MFTIKNLSFSYSGNKKIINDLSLSISKGKIVVILGENGAGKSTLLELVANTLQKQSGHVEFDGIEHSSIQYRQNLAYISEWEMLYPKLTVIEYIILMTKLWKMDFDETRSNELLEKFGLLEHKYKFCDTLSKGMNQKLTLIGSLIHDPKFIIMDEPFTGLDLLSIHEIKKTLKEEAAKNKLIILTTHIIPFAQDIADEILFFKNGEIKMRLLPEDWNVNGVSVLEKKILHDGYERFYD